MGTKSYIRWLKDDRGNPTAFKQIYTPSVSKIIKEIPDPELDKFIEDVGEEKAEQIMQAAAYRGTAMHLFLENFLNEFKESKDPTKALKFTQQNSPPQLKEQEVPDDKIEIGRNLFYNYYYSNYCNADINIHGSEVKFYSPTYFFRGVVDLLYSIKLKGLSITDFKTSSSRIQSGTTKEKKYKAQLGAYTLGIEDMYESKGKIANIEYASIIVMHTKRDSVQEVVCEGKELKEYKEYFKDLVVDFHKNHHQSFLFNNNN